MRMVQETRYGHFPGEQTTVATWEGPSMFHRGNVQPVLTDFDNVPFHGIASSLSTREVLLEGPCVVSGVQNLNAEELIFVLSGSVEICDADGDSLACEDSCILIKPRQRYHLHITSEGEAKLLTMTVPAFWDARQIEDAKAGFKDRILNWLGSDNRDPDSS